MKFNFMTDFFVGNRIMLYENKTTETCEVFRKSLCAASNNFVRICLDVEFRLQKSLGRSWPQRADQYALVSRLTGAASREAVFSWG